MKMSLSIPRRSALAWGRCESLDPRINRHTEGGIKPVEILKSKFQKAIMVYLR